MVSFQSCHVTHMISRYIAYFIVNCILDCDLTLSKQHSSQHPPQPTRAPIATPTTAPITTPTTAPTTTQTTTHTTAPAKPTIASNHSTYSRAVKSSKCKQNGKMGYRHLIWHIHTSLYTELVKIGTHMNGALFYFIQIKIRDGHHFTGVTIAMEVLMVSGYILCNFNIFSWRWINFYYVFHCLDTLWP